MPRRLSRFLIAGAANPLPGDYVPLNGAQGALQRMAGAALLRESDAEVLARADVERLRRMAAAAQYVSAARARPARRRTAAAR